MLGVQLNLHVVFWGQLLQKLVDFGDLVALEAVRAAVILAAA